MSRCLWKGPNCLSCAIWSGAIIEEKRVSTLNSVGISSRQDGKWQCFFFFFFFFEVYDILVLVTVIEFLKGKGLFKDINALILVKSQVQSYLVHK